METPQRPSGPGLGGALCDQCRWKLDWEVKLGLSSGRAERGGGGKTAVGAAGGAGDFWESGGSHGGFSEDPVGDRVAGTGLGAGDRVPRCALMCVCHCTCMLVVPPAHACWVNGSLLKAPSSPSKVSLLGPCLAVPHHLWRSWQDERGWSLPVAPSPPCSFGEIENWAPVGCVPIPSSLDSGKSPDEDGSR